MISSDDEQDDNSVYDQLKSIKPFTLDQLYLLQPDVTCPTSQSTTNGDLNIQISDTYHDGELYQNLTEYEQLRIKLTELRDQVKKLHLKTFEHIDKVWVLKEESLRKIGMCQQGKIAETTFKYRQASLNSKQLEIFDVSFSELTDVVNKEYIYYSFESQMKRHKIATQLSWSYQTEDVQEREQKLKSAIATLLDFIKHLGDSKSEFVSQCRKWLRGLIKRFLQQETTTNFRFVINQLSKGPAGTADWSADLIECKPYDRTSCFESVPQYISHCSALLSELFSSFRTKLTSMGIDQLEAISKNPSTDQNWSLIDPRFSCSEELNVASSNENILSECDMIKFCLRIPVAQIFRAYVKKCLATDDLHLETDKNYEYIMLKLLTIGTIIIKTYQIGLETFNSIQYGNLIEYLSSQIRRTVIVLSDQWTEFKRRLKGVDDALLMRLQVEYDSFILRSILIILELRQSGIWRHLSSIEPEGSRESDNSNNWSTESFRPTFFKLLQATGLSPAVSAPSQANDTEASSRKPTRSRSSNSLTYEFSTEWFKEVSESMLWHILWQFYHSAFTNSCDYHSDNYWLQKFREKSVIYLFVNKIRDSPIGECSYLLNSITSMVLSRVRSDSKLVKFIANEIINLSFEHESTKEKVAREGIKCLIRCAEKFPNLISLYIDYLANGELEDDNIIELFKGCSLSGWLCNENEVDIIAGWLVEQPLTSITNKVARLIMTKLLMNSPNLRSRDMNVSINESVQKLDIRSLRNRKSTRDCFVDLKLRRRFALLLYQACSTHAPENGEITTQSLGASVEVAFGSIYCERTATSQNNLIELSIGTRYNQFYVWCWRLLFTLRLHILNQPETDWNDVQSRSGTSRSIKNTVLFDDSFHLVPSIQDHECLSLAQGIKNENPTASFVYLLMTDVTWQADTLDTCLNHLNNMARTGHLTPSLLAMQFLSICHLNDLCEVVAKDQRCIEYFTTVILSNFDPGRLASLIMAQLDRLKQFRQLQLSQFYIRVFIEVATSIEKQVSSSWFSGNEHYLEKIACVLDYIVKFNFTTQRNEIIRKFYDCSYSVQAAASTSGWLGPLFASNSLNAATTKREFLTTLHGLTQRYKKYAWLRWVTTECDALRLEKIWEDLVVHLSSYEDSNIDIAIKKVCPQVNVSILKSILPIHSWTKQIFDIMESDLSHPLCPLIWYNFFLNYFANSLNGVSVGLNLVSVEIQTNLMTRLESLFNYHLYKHKNWNSSSLQQNSLARLYRAYKLWLQDPSLRDAYVDIDRLKEEYLVPLLKAVMESSTEDACVQFIDIESIETQNKNLIQLWSTATTLEGNDSLKKIVFVESNQDDSMDILTSVEDEASDAAASLLTQPYSAPPEQNKTFANSEEELKRPVQQPVLDMYQSFDEVIKIIKHNFQNAFNESSMFNANLGELDKTKLEIKDLARKLYSNKEREIVRVVPCIEGNECPGPARIKFKVEEAIMDERKSQCIQDRRRQCEEVVLDLLSMPTMRVIQSTIVIEENIKHLVGDHGRSKQVIETLLKWVGEPEAYKQLIGSYYPASQLLKNMLDTMSTSEHVDTYNTILIHVCFDHPKSVQIFSPYLAPSACSSDCFLELYKEISEKHSTLGPTAMFVILSKFDVNLWLNNTKNKQMHHDIIKATCYALKGMGKDPDESFISTFELYKRHIHLELNVPDRRRPEEILLVLNQFLQHMDEQSLKPSLWLDLLGILGLEKTIHSVDDSDRISNRTARSPTRSLSSVTASDTTRISIQLGLDAHKSTTSEMIGDISRLADCQMVLDYYALDSFMKVLSQFIGSKRSTLDITVLEFYSDYLEEFSLVMLSLTFMWIKTVSEQYPDNHELIWNQLMEIWYDWVFFSKNCQNVGKTSYESMANNYVSTLSYMIQKIPDNTQSVLHSILSTLTRYVEHTKEVVYLELTILQRCLRKLPWSRLLVSPADFENLALLSEQENYNISDLVSHIIMQVDIKSSLKNIHENQPDILPRVAERLATIIIIQSAQLKGFRLLSGYFIMVPVDQLTRLSALILTKMEFANLEHSQTNKLLINLLRLMCIRLDLADSNQQQSTQLLYSDNLERSIVYGNFVSNYLVDLIRNHPTILQHHDAYLCGILDNSLQDLRILLSPDVDLNKKTQIYGNILECCSCEQLSDDARLFLTKAFINSKLVTSRPVVVLEVFHAIGKIMRDGQILAFAIEKMISVYLNMNGYYEKVLKSFSLKVLPSDLYLEACIEESTPLALLVYFESLYRSGQDGQQMSESSTSFNVSGTKIWSSFFHWVAQLSVKPQTVSSNAIYLANDTKLTIAWLRLVDMLESDLQHFLLNDRVISDKVTGGDNKSETGSLSSQPSTMSNGQRDANSATAITTSTLTSSHRSLLNFLKQLISVYDANNSGSLWSYLKYSRNDQGSRISIVALAVACFLTDRASTCLNDQSGDDVSKHILALRDEINKLRKTCLVKLDAARKTKNYLSYNQFIEALIESVNRNDKVQYSEGVQLIVTFVKTIYATANEDDVVCMRKILPTIGSN